MLKDLVLKNRSVRGFDPAKVQEADLREMVDCARLSPSSVNMQPLRYVLVTDDVTVERMHDEVKLGGKLPELHLPFPGTEPPAYIVVCQDEEVSGSPMFIRDVGISDAVITLAAAEMGYGACIIGNFSPEKVAAVLGLPERYAVKQVIAIGRPAEQIELIEIEEGESTDYFRDEEGTHFVPKRRLEDVIIKL